MSEMVTAHIEPEDVPEDARRAKRTPWDWWLADGEALHAEHPRSFFIPDRARREALRPGELVKLEFGYGPHADLESEGNVERMWVEVLGEPGRGRLRNQPFRLSELDLGDEIAFAPEHVISIDFSDEELGYEQDQSALVDVRILAEDRPPDAAVRARGVWFLLCRDSGTGPVDERVNRLIDLFPSLIEPFRAGEGMWERREDERYHRVEPDLELVAELERFAQAVKR